jgi:type IV pilus assembly protein PilV
MSLIENLIALVLLAVALLGMAVLSNRALSVTRGNVYRQQAIQLTDDLSNRLFAHVRGRGIGSDAVADCSAASASCLASPSAQDELASWRRNVADALPGGNGVLGITTAGARMRYEITVTWLTTEPNPAEHRLAVAAPW